MSTQGYLNYKRIPKPLRIPRLTVEIGFGNGEFLAALARRHPERNFLGIELSGISIEKLLKRIREANLKNLFCVRLDAYWAFLLLFENETIETIYMNYPDPWFKKRHHKRRLTRPANLYIFARRLKTGGEILIRTDDRPFLEYSLESAQEVGAFEIKVETLKPEAPLTKYEAKWVAEGKTLYVLTLKKTRPPRHIPHPVIEEVENVFPVKVPNIKNLPETLQKTFRPREGLVIRTFNVWEKGEDRLLEILLSEEGYLQRFLVFIKKKPTGYQMDVSSFSEVLKTRGLQEALEFLAKQVSAQCIS
ncbi:tRNA (guanosine(46)-N7)-methyltransferase TrmB [Thermosulfurimonas dismutans]|uniref:tRNA (guanine-N(7)-)-methyltransferase n=1 Tax=Thermosulfurimonas dismutans TaxID=999894 RepID=A0A179D3B8_9BACT|nr:tRNA (guanosine(46)-N7)-methyltransferase TrmB [Thermosulfurimonas dismutans]OAQ20574.1 tRNA (guanine46-N7-)-methyltransferase [Thermosulfurimonas dismutans]